MFISVWMCHTFTDIPGNKHTTSETFTDSLEPEPGGHYAINMIALDIFRP